MKSAIAPGDREIYKKIVIIGMPMIIQNLIQHFQVLIDRAWLGNLKVEYLSALGNALIPYSAITSFLWAAALGTTIIVSHRIGAREFDAARDYSQISYLASTLIAVILFFVWFFFSRRIFSVVGVEGEILNYADNYIRIIIFSLFIFGIDLTSVSILQGVGVTVPIMITGLFKNGLNFFLDWVLIFGNLGAPALELEGAALATTIANYLGTFILFFILLGHKKVPFKITLKGIFTTPWGLYKDVFKIGFPSGVEVVLWQTGQLISIRILNSINPMAAGYYTLVYGIQLVAFFMYLGFSRAGTTLIGQRWGAGEYEAGIHIGKLCLKLMMVICTLAAVFFLLFPRAILSVFTNDLTTINQCVPLIYVIAFVAYFQALNVIAGGGVKGTGDTKWMLYSQIFGTILIISLSALFVFIFKLGVTGMFLAMLIDETLRGFLNWFRFTWGTNPLGKLAGIFSSRKVD